MKDIMSNRIVSDEKFLAVGRDLFRAYGFEGVSLKRLADTTGLGKASLYFRYPGGKDEIAIAVVKHVIRWFQVNVIDLLDEPGPAHQRVSMVAEHLRGFYAEGSESSLADLMSIPGTPEQVRLTLKLAMEAWVNAFTRIAIRSGIEPVAARSKAEEAVVCVEGSLVMARISGDCATFERVLNLLPDFLTTPKARLMP
jgi:TetR/AcrR family transcriptional regulator, lmrAB and yxaGH operons repressor